MNALRLISKVLWQAFYRAHVLPIGLAAFFFLGLARPPHLLFTGLFVRSLVLNDAAALIVAMICMTWAIYTAYFMVRALADSKLEFLSILGVLSTMHIFGVALWNVLMAGLPAWFYVMLMGYHAMTIGLDSAWLFLLTPPAWVLASSIFLYMAMAHPKPQRGRIFNLKVSWGGYARLLWQVWVRSNRITWYLVKGVSLLFVALMVQAGPDAVLPQIASLGCVVSGLLHAALVFQLRREELARLNWVKSLPLPAWKRIGDHLMLQLIVVLPEVGLLSMAFMLGIAPLEWTWSCLLALMATQILGLGLSYLPSMTGQDFLRMMFAVFVFSFLGLVFRIPLVLIHFAMMVAGLVLSSVWIYRVDESLD